VLAYTVTNTAREPVDVDLIFKSICDTQSEIASKYNVTAIPHLAIIDAQGYVRIIKVGYSRTAATDLANEIKELQTPPKD